MTGHCSGAALRSPAHAALYRRVRPLCGFGPEADEIAERIIELFAVVEQRNQDVDVTTFGSARRRVIRVPWLVAAVPDGPATTVETEELDFLDAFGRPSGFPTQ